MNPHAAESLTRQTHTTQEFSGHHGSHVVRLLTSEVTKYSSTQPTNPQLQSKMKSHQKFSVQLPAGTTFLWCCVPQGNQRNSRVSPVPHSPVAPTSAQSPAHSQRILFHSRTALCRGYTTLILRDARAKSPLPQKLNEE